MKDNKNKMNIAIFGASGAIGSAFVNQLANNETQATIFAFSRSMKKFEFENVHFHSLDITDENSIAQASVIASKETPLDLVLVTTGLLHNKNPRATRSSSRGRRKETRELLDNEMLGTKVIRLAAGAGIVMAIGFSGSIIPSFY